MDHMIWVINDLSWIINFRFELVSLRLDLDSIYSKMSWIELEKARISLASCKDEFVFTVIAMFHRHFATIRLERSLGGGLYCSVYTVTRFSWPRRVWQTGQVWQFRKSKHYVATFGRSWNFCSTKKASLFQFQTLDKSWNVFHFKPADVGGWELKPPRESKCARTKSRSDGLIRAIRGYFCTWRRKTARKRIYN